MPSEGGNIEVEHFAPKSLYPDLTFEWDNLLPACRKCNEAKSDFDTIKNPILDPSKIDPEKFLTYDFLRISAIENCAEEQVAKTTIKECNLNSSRLYIVRASLMKSLTEYADELKEKIELVKGADTPQKKRAGMTKLRNSLERIEPLLDSSSAYAGYCRWFISHCYEYKQAKKLTTNEDSYDDTL